MNYIKKLEQENAALKLNAANVEKEISLFQSFLMSEKFQGFDSKGERKDWISTADVNARLMELRNILNAS